MVITSCSIDNAGFSQLSVMATLRKLHMQTNWGTEGWQGSMEHLEVCLPQLTELVLSGTATTLAAREAFDGRILEEEQRGLRSTFRCRGREVL